MTGDHHRTNKIQHAQPQPLLNPIASHRMYHEQQGSGSMNESSPAVMEGNAFHDFTYPFGGIDQSHMMNMPDVSYGNHIGAAFTQHHGLSSNGPPMTHHISSMSGTPGPAFSSDQGHRGTSLELVEDGGGGGGGRGSPAEHSFEDAGTDEFGLLGNNRADGTDLGGRNGDDKSRAPPAWSELKTKAGKDRKRLPLACIACRRKKIRCSGEKPACKHCLRSRIPCVYKVTTRKAAPRTDYMAMLDKRLKRMEDRIIKIIPKPDQDATSFITRAIVRPAVLGANAGNKSASKKRGAEEAFGSDLESWAKAPSSVRVKGAESADEDSAAKEGSFSADHVLFQQGIDALPPKEIQEHLAEVFFDNVYGQAYHLLHKPSYMRKLKSNTLPPVLVLSVCAVAARFATQSNIAGTTRPFLRGEEWASHARDICTRRYEWPNMTVLTCLLILGLHEFGTCHGGRSWALGGQAIRMAFALQLHKDLEDDASGCGNKVPLSFVDREIRRRIMWACFLMDRFNSSGSDRPMFIKEELIQIQLPVKESYFQLGIPAQTESLDGSAGRSESPSDGQDTPREENMGVAAYTIRAVAIWGRIVAYLHQGRENMEDFALCNERSIYAQLVEQVEDLQRTLPESLKYSVDNLNLHATEKTGSQFLLMHLSIQQNALFLHKAAAARAATDGAKDVPSEFVPQQASAQTVTAANRISEMLRDAEQAKCNVTAPFAGYCAFSATNIHMLGIFSSNAAVKATAEVNAGINIKFLRKTMRYWGMFHWMVEKIRTQYRNALEASRSGKLGTQGLGAWPVLQFADWFNRYPHGVSDFDVVEPTTVQRRRERGEDAVLEQKPELQSVEDYFTSLASPSSTEGHGPPPPPPPPASKRKQTTTKKSSESAGSNNSNNNNNNNKLNNGKAIDGAGQSTAGQRAASRQLSVSVSVSGGSGQGRGQANGPASAGYNHHPVGPGPLSHVHTQQPSYTAMSPGGMSPAAVQTSSPFPPPGPGQSPFFAPDMLQMNGMGHRGSADLSPNLDSPHASFGYGLSSGAAQNMMDSSAATWQAKNASDTKMLHHNQQAVKVNGGHHTQGGQGQMGADGLVEFSGSDLPAGWVMPFSIDIDPRADLQDMSTIPREGEPSHGAADPFNSIFGATGVGIHQSIASLHAHGG